MRFSQLASIRKVAVQPSKFSAYSIYLGFEHFDPGTLRFNKPGNPSNVTSTKQAFHAGDTLYGKLRPYFRKVGWARDLSGLCSTDLWVFEPKPGVESRFVFYVAGCQAFSDLASSSSEGTRMPRASWSVVKDFEIPDFTLDEQRAIAATLGALDDKIESNRRAIDLAEALADQLFARKAKGSAVLTDIAKLTMGSSPPGNTYNEDNEGMPFYQGVRDFGRRFPGYRVWTTGAVRLAQNNDTLVSVRAPVGKLNRSREICCIGRGVAAVSSDWPSTIFYALRSADSIWEPFQHEGTVFGAINKVDLSKAQLPWPQADSLRELESNFSVLDEKIWSLSTEIEDLIDLRNTLLPELLSGRIRVPEAHETVQEVIA